MNTQEDHEFEQFLREKAAEAKRDLKFPATLFLRMLGVDGGYKTAVKLLSARHPSDGFTDLIVLGRPDLTVEALVVESEWRRYFDPLLVKKTEDLLRKSGYRFKPFIAAEVKVPLVSEADLPNEPGPNNRQEQDWSGIRSLAESADEESYCSALDDLESPLGSAVPDRSFRTVNSFQRDAKVRRAVLHRADGKCEYCKTPGFETPDRSRYLEAHHIIGLAQNGPDTMENVIALCPQHHKEAHYGLRAESLERKFMAILAALV